MAQPFGKEYGYEGLFRAFGLDELAVEACDVRQGDVLGALGGAGTGVGAVAEAEFVHLADHGAGAALALYLALGQECELADLGRDEEHGGAVLAGGDTCAAADAGGGVHGLVGDGLRDGNVVCVGSAAAVERHVAAGLLNLVEGVAVDGEVADDGERGRAPGLDGDDVAVVELAHVQLAGGYALDGTVGMAVDVEGAHAADALAAVVVEDDGFLAALDQQLVEHVEHLEEGLVGRDAVEVVFDELTRFFGTALTPNLQVYANSIFHFESVLTG